MRLFCLGSLLVAGAAQAQAPTVTSLSPARNARSAPRATDVTVGFSQGLSNNAATLGALRVFSQQAGGQKTGTATVNGNTLTFNPTTDFKPGETVQATVTAAAQSSTGTSGLPQVWQFTTATAPSTGTFSGGSDLPTASTYPGTWVTTGDVDKDGDLDLVTVNYNYDGEVNVRRNDGLGRFGNPEFVGTERGPRSATLADVDGDGDLDLLVVTIYSVGNVSVRLNDGNGRFSGQFTGLYDVRVGSYPQNVVAADLDADGDLDFVTANRNSLALSVRLNNGLGLFSSSQEVAVRNQPSRVAAADVDGDGDVDLISGEYSDSNNSNGSISVHLNTGQGSFTSSYEVVTGVPAFTLVLADVNGDGHVDLLVSIVNRNSVSVRLNDGTGRFTSSSEVSLGESGNGSPATLAAADIDGDGDLDLLASNFGTPNSPASPLVSVRLNDGQGRFSGNQQVAIESGSASITLGDLDGDGTLDLATANASGSVSVRLNKGVLATAPAQLTQQVSIYPNPARTFVRLRLPVELAKQRLQIQFVNALGQTVLTQILGAQATPEVPLAPLAAGIYSVQIRTTQGIVTKRLVIE